jgi:hypothetical protein
MPSYVIVQKDYPYFVSLLVIFVLLSGPANSLTHVAPILEAVEYETVRFDGAFAHKNVYKGDPRPELDAAWDRIEARQLDSNETRKFVDTDVYDH